PLPRRLESGGFQHRPDLFEASAPRRIEALVRQPAAEYISAAGLLPGCFGMVSMCLCLSGSCLGCSHRCCFTIGGQSTISAKVGSIDPCGRRGEGKSHTPGNSRGGTKATDNLGSGVEFFS